MAAPNQYGGFYMAAPSGALWLLDSLGRVQRQASHRDWAGASALWAGASVQVWVFSEMPQQACRIDRWLGRHEVLPMPEEGYYQCAAPALGGGFWALDAQSLRLERRAETGALALWIPLQPQLPAETVWECAGLLEAHGQVWLLLEGQGMASWSISGAFAQWLPIPGARHFDLQGNRLWVWTHREWLEYGLDGRLLRQAPLPPGQWTAWSASPQYLLGLRGQEACLFPWPPP